VHWENGKQDANGEVADEGEGDGGKNFGDGAGRAFERAWLGGRFWKRVGDGGGGGVGHRKKPNP